MGGFNASADLGFFVEILGEQHPVHDHGGE